jgi:large subunit ribosomal protein L18
MSSKPKQPRNSRADARRRRHFRVRKNVSGTAQRPRLCVYRSNKHLAALLVDDVSGKTMASVSTAQTALKTKSNNLESAKKVGSTIAEKAKAMGVSEVVFDRSGYLYHGRVAAIADAAREAGLKF